jgi:hypothetical protein
VDDFRTVDDNRSPRAILFHFTTSETGKLAGRRQNWRLLARTLPASVCNSRRGDLTFDKRGEKPGIRTKSSWGIHLDPVNPDFEDCDPRRTPHDSLSRFAKRRA